MARIRAIKPEFFSSPSTANCSYEARLLFIAMWTLADDWGIGEANAKQLAAYAFPLDEISSKEIPCLCKEIISNFNTVFYKHSGRTYFQILNWDEHQVTQRRAKRRYPDSNDPLSQVILGVQELPGIDKEIPCIDKENTSTEQGNRGTGEQGNSVLRISAKAENTQQKKEEREHEFEEFWKHYPVKSGKKNAYTAYLKARKKTSQQTLIQAAQKYAQWLALDPTRKPKWAQGWLNDERWTDELNLAPANNGRPDTLTLITQAGNNLKQTHKTHYIEAQNTWQT